VHKLMKTIIGIAAVAALGIVTLAPTAQDARAQAAAAAQAPAAAAAQAPAAKKAKVVKDTGEYDIYNDVIKDSQTNPPVAKKFLADLDTWTQKYPDTDFKDTRAMYYAQAYAANNEVGKALDTAKPLVDKGIDGLKAGLDGDYPVLQLLYLASRLAANAAVSGTPTQEQLATGTKASQLLAEFAKAYFAKDKKPATATDEQWAAGLKQIDDQAQGTLFQIALYPGTSAVKPNPRDPAGCAAAEEAFKKVLTDYPDSGYLAYQLAKVSVCQQTVTPAKIPQALYFYARAVGLPVGGTTGLSAADQKTYDTYLKGAYTTIHGSDEGLPQLKELAVKSPLPPADFKIKTASEIEAQAAEEFQTKNPQLATWMSVKSKLKADDGQQYFDGQLKDSDMSGPNGTKLLKGTLLEGKPACRSRELLVAIPLPDATGAPTAEITLKLVNESGQPVPLTGKAETGGEIQFNGVPAAFTKDPFMLTMDTDKTKIDGLVVTPCTAAPPKKSAAPAKKKAQ